MSFVDKKTSRLGCFLQTLHCYQSEPGYVYSKRKLRIREKKKKTKASIKLLGKNQNDSEMNIGSKNKNLESKYWKLTQLIVVQPMNSL